jgi:hypothetical protein
MLYAPNPLQGGSSISHWDVSATPNLLMEPFTSHDVSGSVDLTRDLFEDLGWFAGVARPSVARLGEAFPNPFQSSPVSIPFELDRAGAVDVAVHDLNGRLVRRLMHGAMPAGPGVASWDGTDESGRRMRPGVYLCRLRFEGASQARRLVLVK